MDHWVLLDMKAKRSERLPLYEDVFLAIDAKNIVSLIIHRLTPLFLICYGVYGFLCKIWTEL